MDKISRNRITSPSINIKGDLCLGSVQSMEHVNGTTPGNIGGNGKKSSRISGRQGPNLDVTVPGFLDLILDLILICILSFIFCTVSLYMVLCSYSVLFSCYYWFDCPCPQTTRVLVRTFYWKYRYLLTMLWEEKIHPIEHLRLFLSLRLILGLSGLGGGLEKNVIIIKVAPWHKLSNESLFVGVKPLVQEISLAVHKGQTPCTSKYCVFI